MNTARCRFAYGGDYSDDTASPEILSIWLSLFYRPFLCNDSFLKSVKAACIFSSRSTGKPTVFFALLIR